MAFLQAITPPPLEYLRMCKHTGAMVFRSIIKFLLSDDARIHGEMACKVDITLTRKRYIRDRLQNGACHVMLIETQEGISCQE